MAIGSNNGSVLERQNTVTLRGLPRNPETKRGGGITVELQPRKGWREQAVKGLLSLQYRVSARAEIEMSDGTKQMRSVNAFFPAVSYNQLVTLGECNGKSFFRLNEDGSAKTHLVSGAAGFDSTAIAVDSENRVILDDNGHPIIEEQSIVTEGGEEFDMLFGCIWIIESDNSLTLRMNGVSAYADERGKPDGNGRPYLNLYCDDYEVIAIERCTPKGKAMAFGFNVSKAAAARQNAAAARQNAAAVQDIEDPESF